MAFEPIYEVAALDSRQKLCSGQVITEARLIPPPNVAVSKILAVSCSSVVNATEAFTGEARYSGRVIFKVMFADEEGGCYCLEYNSDFTDKLVSDSILSNSRPILDHRILDTDIVSVTAGEIKLAAVVEVDLFSPVSQRIKYLSKGGENVYTHEDRIDFDRLAAESDNNFTVNDTLQDFKAVKILMVEPRVITTSRTSSEDCVTVEGNIICDITALEEEGLIKSYHLSTPFSQQVPATNAKNGDVAIGDVKLVSFVPNLESDGETGGLSIEYNLNIHLLVFTEDVINPIVDAFSVTNELLVTGESLNIIKHHDCLSFNDRVEGSVTLDVNMPIADNILAVTNSKVNLSNVHAYDGKIVMEGIINAGILYYSAELNSKNSLSVELPFSLTLPAEVSESSELCASAEVTSINVKIRRGNELDIKAEIYASVNINEPSTKYIITELKLGEAIEMPTNAISIHIAKPNETLWEAAKALGTTPEIILLQNPHLILPLQGGERIITYRHLMRE